jgi:hypothetical protein
MEYGEEEGRCACCDIQPSESTDFSRRLRLANMFYVGYFAVFAVICFVLYNSGTTWLGRIIQTDHTDPESIGIACVARTTFPLVLWFIIHALLAICNQNLEDSFQFLLHTSHLWLHALIGLALWVGFWFVPDPFLDFYTQASVYISVIYLILQLLFLLNFILALNASWTEQRQIWVLCLVTAVLECASLTAFGVSYYLFTKDDCSSNLAFISINLSVTILLFVASIFIDGASILASSLVSAYVAYLTVTGLNCEFRCSRLSSPSQEIGISIVAVVVTFVWAIRSAYSLARQFQDLPCFESSEEQRIFSLSSFHAMFALASVYVTMIVTHWGKAEEGARWVTGKGLTAKWVNVASRWLILVLYAIRLVAPYIWPDRDWPNG